MISPAPTSACIGDVSHRHASQAHARAICERQATCSSRARLERLGILASIPREARYSARRPGRLAGGMNTAQTIRQAVADVERLREESRSIPEIGTAVVRLKRFQART